MGQGRAIVLSGGGAKGAFQVGVLKGMHKMGLLQGVEHFYGTSVGALNAAAMAYSSVYYLESIWRSIRSKSDILKWNWFYKGLYNTKPLHHLIDTLTQFSPSKKATVTVVDYKSGELLYKRENDPDFLKWVEASACIPGLMRPIDDRYVDGGVREIAPIGKAIKDGYTEIDVILASPTTYEPARDYPWFLDPVLSSIDIMTHEIYINDIKLCYAKNQLPGYKNIKLRVFKPKELLLHTLDFDPESIRRGIDYGERTLYQQI